MRGLVRFPRECHELRCGSGFACERDQVEPLQRAILPCRGHTEHVGETPTGHRCERRRSRPSYPDFRRIAMAMHRAQLRPLQLTKLVRPPHV